MSLRLAGSWLPRICGWLLVLITIVVTTGSQAAQPARARASLLASVETSLEIESIAHLDDRGQPVVGRPRWVSEGPTGRFLIGDSSDRDIKVYSADGSRLSTIGRAGPGPGELGNLSANALLEDRILAYDFGVGLLSSFDLNGHFIGSTRFEGAPPWSIRAAGQNRLLLIAHPSRGGPLLRFADDGGTVDRQFFPLPDPWANDRSTLQHVVLFADSHDGLVFASLFGGSQLYVFDYEGRMLQNTEADPVDPLTPLYELTRQNAGKMRRADGTWVHHDSRFVMAVVAIRGSRAIVQVAPYDTKVGTDIVDGGTLLAFEYSNGRVTLLGRTQSEWGLVGRDAAGHALVMRYATNNPDAYELGRVRLRPEGDAPSSEADR